MNTRSILFSAPMIRALLREIEQPGSGKTQTRRVVKRTDSGRVSRGGRNWHLDDPNAVLACPYGQPGDLLWARETWRPHGADHGPLSEQETSTCIGPENCDFAADADEAAVAIFRFYPSIHMPRWASRITLHLTDVRVERVQDISDEDAKAEGLHSYHYDWPDCEYPLPPVAYEPRPGAEYRYSCPIQAFGDLWNSINAKRGYGWDTNPWAWVLSFRPILANVDDVSKGRRPRRAATVSS